MNVCHGGRWLGRFSLALLLAGIFPLLFAQAVSAQTQGLGDASASIEHDFVGARKCKSCHGKELMGDQNATWRAGPHARAFKTLSNAQSLAIAGELGLSGAPSDAPACLVCHLTAYGVPEEQIWKPLNSEEGVQCESCHGPGRDYRKKKIMADIDKARANGLWDLGKDHEICLRCHNDASPTFDPHRYTLSDGSTRDFDYDQAAEQIAHPIPEHVKGRYLELRKKQKEEEERQKNH